MAKVISIHSFRAESGKSHITANLAAIIAAAGQRVAVIDSDFTPPSIQQLFGVDAQRLRYSLNDFLWGKCTLEQTALRITPNIPMSIKGELFLIPFVIPAEPVEYDIDLLSDSFDSLIEQLQLDVLLIDTKYGVHSDSLPTIAFSDTQLLVLRLSEEYFEGTGVAIDVADQLGIAEMVLLINQVPDHYDFQQVKHYVEQTFKRPVVAVLPAIADLADVNHMNVFVIEHPNHPLTMLLTHVAATLTA